MKTITASYIEQDCTFAHEGKSFTAGGAVVTDEFATAYMSNDMSNVIDWHGNFLGYARITSSWRIFSFLTDRMYQVEATINGVRYTGRTAGAGMVWNGKRCKRQ